MNNHNVTIHVANIKCHGCANTIKNRLEGLEGISEVNVGVEDGSVSFIIKRKEDTVHVQDLLTKLGYPEGNPTMFQTAKKLCQLYGWTYW